MLFQKRSERLFIWIFFPLMLMMPLFLDGNIFYINKLSSILIFALFVMSLDYLVGRCGLITLGHAMFYGLGGYIFYIIAPQNEAVNFWVYTFYICVISAAIALIVGFFSPAHQRYLYDYDYPGDCPNVLLLLLRLDGVWRH